MSANFGLRPPSRGVTDADVPGRDLRIDPPGEGTYVCLQWRRGDPQGGETWFRHAGIVEDFGDEVWVHTDTSVEPFKIADADEGCYFEWRPWPFS